MKLHILSDLHIEFEPFSPLVTNADVIILAGDIHIGRKGVDWAKHYFIERPVIYVLGNHEYYKKAFPKHIDDLKGAVKGTNIHILENDSLIINDIKFLGCTLWTDFSLFGEPKIAGYEATQIMTDYRKIRVSPEYRKLRSIDTAIIHNRSLRWLGEQLLNNQSQKIVVITHHAPSKRSVPSGEQDNILSAAYASNLDKFVEESSAALWIHGHIHCQQDYWLGNTRIICNPRGYPDEGNENFIPDLVIEM